MRYPLFLLALFLALTLIVVSCEQQGCEPPQADPTNGGWTIQGIGMPDTSDSNSDSIDNMLFIAVIVWIEEALGLTLPTSCEDLPALFDASWAYGQMIADTGGDLSEWIAMHELLIWAYGGWLQECTADADVQYLFGPGIDSD